MAIDMMDAARSRRAILKSAMIVAGGLAVPGCMTAEKTGVPVASVDPFPQPVATRPPAPVVFAATPRGVRPELFARAMAALDTHVGKGLRRDRIAIADFTAFSSNPRLDLVDIQNGRVQTLLVSHGSGSDPEHTGLLKQFSNIPGSNATSQGAYRTDSYYFGKHGLSQRLIGLDDTNNNALDRAIVIHSAWYANPDMIAKHGKLGRSQGCFAVGENALQGVFDALGQDRLLFAGRSSRA